LSESPSLKNADSGMLKCFQLII